MTLARDNIGMILHFNAAAVGLDGSCNLVPLRPSSCLYLSESVKKVTQTALHRLQGMNAEEDPRGRHVSQTPGICGNKSEASASAKVIHPNREDQPRLP
ncbi:hypothetical protein VTL71DRAFT_490 [Oculimacula yallundae]|uniref:Uncharacterized protein n=1 Tax=Oculimacula yallundae TaxID=86028 RepID=A0ABR4D066_9HELO